MYKIMIVEDDLTIAKALKSVMESWGYEALLAADFKSVLEQFVAYEPHLVLMDIGLPFYNGYHWCNEIRKLSKVPIIFISSAADNLNIVMAMNMGADDFIAKPFDMSVFIAKIQALLRRTYAFAGQTSVVTHKGVFLNLGEVTLAYHGHKVELTKNELKMLQVLLEHPGCAVSRSEIMSKLWESDHFIDDNTLTVNMTRLRKKLEEVGLHDFIVTKKGIGYMVE
jgi:DNA-binding response OmpR family regulator